MKHDKLDLHIGMAKQLIAKAVGLRSKNLKEKIAILNKQVCIAVAEFKCQKCGTEKDLQHHHLITTKAQYFVDYWRYFSQRNYWANQIILCQKCHCEFHNYNQDTFKSLTQTISPEYISKVKAIYEIEAKESMLEQGVEDVRD